MKKIYLVLGIMFIMLLVACGIKSIEPDKTVEAEDINMKIEDKGGGVIKDTEEDKEEAEGLEPETKIEELELPDNKGDDDDDNKVAIDTNTESQEELTFIECNETVYATSSVNLRGGPSTEYDKVGSLSSGQSVTRVGIGTGDYSSWSQVQLADGSIVYVSSNYISITKPSTQQTSGGTTQNKTNNGGTTTSTSTPSGGGTQSSTSSGGSSDGGQQWAESRGQGISGLLDWDGGVQFEEGMDSSSYSDPGVRVSMS